MKFWPGFRDPEGRKIFGSMNLLKQAVGQAPPEMPNTVLGVVVTNAKLDKVRAGRVARMASGGFARALRPASTLHDGDMVFVLATGKGPALEETVIGALAAEMLAEAIAAAAPNSLLPARMSGPTRI